MFSFNIRLQRDKFSRQHFQTVSQTLILLSYLQTNKKTWLSNLLQKQNMQNEKEWQTHPFAGFFQLGGGGSSLHQPKIFSFCPPRKILLPVDSPLHWIFIPPPPAFSAVGIAPAPFLFKFHTLWTHRSCYFWF